ncbi:MAG: hypothetical protein OXI60_11015 [Acidiferrobacterales bacterium]|nr:hypothetical protein [Acidiferrobacterales bacterium]
MWTKAWSNASPASPVYAQMHELGNFFRSVFEAGQSPSDQAARQRQMEQMMRQFTINPIPPNFPPMIDVSNYNPWQQFFDQGKTLMRPTSLGSQPPALGIGREYQEDWTELLRLQHEYGSALREFTAMFDKFTISASERFIESISDMDENMGFEDVCRQWIDCCDSEFLKVAGTEDFCVAYGNLIDASMRLLRHGTKMQEQLATMAGQPTRTELDDLHLKNSQSTAEIEQLNLKVQDLERRLKSVQASQRKKTSRASSTPKRPSTRSKKTK